LATLAIFWQVSRSGISKGEIRILMLVRIRWGQSEEKRIQHPRLMSRRRRQDGKDMDSGP
jgi:hypothetical protein